MPNTDPYSASFTVPDRLHVDALSFEGASLTVHARDTDRRREALEWIAFALGGEAGARLARELGLLVSPDTLLNRIR
jgi:hypothetical protein